MTKVFLTPDAERELARLSAALDFRSSGLGEKFADAFLTAAEAIAENPDSILKYPRLGETSWCVRKGFPASRPS